MKLSSFRVTNFRSVEDSGDINLEGMICLVGKNEAGKTAVLHALAALNPHPATPITLDRERDYPRRYLNEYTKNHAGDAEGQAVVVSTYWSFHPEQHKAVAARIGPDFLSSEKIIVRRRYGATDYEIESHLNFSHIVKFLVERFQLDAAEVSALSSYTNTDELKKALEILVEPTSAQKSLLSKLRSITNATVLVDSHVRANLPKFMYFSHYDRMVGQIRVDDIVRNGPNAFHPMQAQPHIPQTMLDVGERVFLDFLEFAGTSVEEIKTSTTYESLNARCESASNVITDQLREYWMQNAFLEIEVRVTRGEQQDPAPFNTGVIARARVRNTLHRVSVPFSERSAGFIWFFPSWSSLRRLVNKTDH